MVFFGIVWLGTSFGAAAVLLKRTPPSDDVLRSGTGTGISIGWGTFWKERDLDAGMRLVDALLDSPPDVKKEIQARFLQVPVTLLENMSGVPLATALPNVTACAMVSSSRSVLAAKAGKKIDSVDGPVMRFNFAQTEQFVPWVGERRDIMAVNNLVPCLWAKGWPPHPAWDQKVLLNVGPSAADRGISAACLRRLLGVYPNVSLYALDFDRLNRGLLSLMDELSPDSGVMEWIRFQQPWLTTGMVGAALLLSMCDEVRHYGFLPVREGLGADDCAEHYWDSRTEKCGSDHHHRLTAEHILWAAISARGELPGEGVVHGRPRGHSRPGG